MLNKEEKKRKTKTTKSKYIGVVFEGRWEVVDTIRVDENHYNFLIRNIYNNQEMVISPNRMMRYYNDPSRFSRLRHRIGKKKGKRITW